jgi:4-carboxymuconolactone decarboxylase
MLALTDRFLQDPSPPPPDERTALAEHFDDAEIVEAMLALGLFLGFSKMLIALGFEPEEMDTTVLPTPAPIDEPAVTGE